MLDFAGAWREEGESVEAKGVALMDGPEDAAVATGKVEPLKTDDAELAWELVEPTLGISPGDEPLSSAGGWMESEAEAESEAETDADEEENREAAAGFWQRRAGSVASASVPTAGSCARLSRSRSARPWASVLSLGALGKNCAKLTPGGGRVIVSTSSCYLESRGVLMIPRSGSGKACHASLPPRLGRRASVVRARAPTRPGEAEKRCKIEALDGRACAESQGRQAL